MYKYLIVCRKGDYLKNIEATIETLEPIIYKLSISGWLINHISIAGIL